jgi:hypothetical protein
MGSGPITVRRGLSGMLADEQGFFGRNGVLSRVARQQFLALMSSRSCPLYPQ